MNEPRISFADSKPAMVIALVLVTSIPTGCGTPDRTGRMVQTARTVSFCDPSDDASTTVGHASSLPNKRWHADLAIRNSYPILDSTKKQLDRRMDVPLKSDVFGVFDRPYTPIDRRSDQGYTSLYGGVGRQENPHFLWTYYVGGSSGKDINHGRFLIQTLEVDFKYNFYYTGISAEYYPWDIPSIQSTPSWEERLQASRPFLLTGLESGYVSSEGEGDYKIAGMTAYHDELKIRDWLFRVMVGLGWALPLNDRWSINLSSDYRFHFYRPEEYNGWTFATGIRYRF